LEINHHNLYQQAACNATNEEDECQNWNQPPKLLNGLNWPLKENFTCGFNQTKKDLEVCKNVSTCKIPLSFCGENRSENY